MRYRRANIAGATYFFTVNLADRKSPLLLENIAVLREAVRKVWQAHPFDIIAMVVLPDHLHAIWRLPDGDADFPLRWSLIKATFSREIPKNEIIRRSRILKRERGIWQRRYWEHQIMDDDDLEKHGVHSQQSGKAWLRHPSRRLAAFVDSSGNRTRQY